MHAPPAQEAGLVYPDSVDAAPLCFDAAYDAPGMATIAANAMAAATVIFMRTSHRGVASRQTEMSTLLLTHAAQHAALLMNSS